MPKGRLSIFLPYSSSMIFNCYELYVVIAVKKTSHSTCHKLATYLKSNMSPHVSYMLDLQQMCAVIQTLYVAHSFRSESLMIHHHCCEHQSLSAVASGNRLKQIEGKRFRNRL
jgi:hypothetical protein